MIEAFPSKPESKIEKTEKNLEKLVDDFIKTIRQYEVETLEEEEKRVSYEWYAYEKKGEKSPATEKFEKEKWYNQKEKVESLVRKIVKMKEETPELRKVEEYLHKGREARRLEEKLSRLRKEEDSIIQIEEKETGENLEQIRERLLRESEQYQKLQKEIEETKGKLDQLYSRIGPLINEFPRSVREKLTKEIIRDVIEAEEFNAYMKAFKRRNEVALRKMEENNPYCRLIPTYLFDLRERLYLSKNPPKPDSLDEWKMKTGYYDRRLERMRDILPPWVVAELEKMVLEEGKKGPKPEK
jgi:chromosome segregation ATPase